MKKIGLIFTILLSICFNNISAQISTGGMPVSFDKLNKISATVPNEKMETVDIETLISEDLVNDLNNEIPWRFGKNLFVDISPEKNGLTELLSDGSKLWRVTIESENAVSLNFSFDRFILPEGAKLWIYNSDHSEILGAFTEANNQEDGFFATTLIFDSKITIEYYEPAIVEFSGEIHLYRVTHGYRNGYEYAKGLNTSGSCQVNVNCNDGADWQDEKRGVCMLVVGGDGFCSGSLIRVHP